MLRCLLQLLPHRDLYDPDTDQVYMRRHYLFRSPFGSVFLHNIRTSDTGRDLHDHPWAFMTVLLKGGYVEQTPEGSRRINAPAVAVHSPDDLHRLELENGDAWSLFIHGPRRHNWGFATDQGWIPHDEYDSDYASIHRRSRGRPYGGRT